MPGVFNLSVDEALKEAAECARLGLGGLLLFGLPAEKDEQASGAWDANGIVQTGTAGDEGRCCAGWAGAGG